LPRLLIIGYGNPTRGDDGLGWFAADRLERDFGGPDCRVVYSHQLTPEMAETIAQAERVIFIDARRDGTPGEIRVEDVTPAFDSPTAFTHSVSPGALVAAAGALFGHAPAARLYSVTGECFHFSEALTPTVEAALEKLLRRIRAEYFDA
jgi:hydrogenase maturation protease